MTFNKSTNDLVCFFSKEMRTRQKRQCLTSKNEDDFIIIDLSDDVKDDDASHKSKRQTTPPTSSSSSSSLTTMGLQILAELVVLTHDQNHDQIQFRSLTQEEKTFGIPVTVMDSNLILSTNLNLDEHRLRWWNHTLQPLQDIGHDGLSCDMGFAPLIPTKTLNIYSRFISYESMSNHQRRHSRQGKQNGKFFDPLWSAWKIPDEHKLKSEAGYTVEHEYVGLLAFSHPETKTIRQINVELEMNHEWTKYERYAKRLPGWTNDCIIVNVIATIKISKHSPIFA
jgi:hypothetical protein